jgi:hypothetical protein
VGYCYPSGLEKTLFKWDLYVPLVTKWLSMLRFYENAWKSNFRGYIWTEGLLVTVQSAKAVILIYRIVWVTTNGGYLIYCNVPGGAGYLIYCNVPGGAGYLIYCNVPGGAGYLIYRNVPGGVVCFRDYDLQSTVAFNV